jgi:hypothetical protein
VPAGRERTTGGRAGVIAFVPVLMAMAEWFHSETSADGPFRY